MRKVAVIVVFLAAIAGGVWAGVRFWPPSKCRITGTITRDGKPLEWKDNFCYLLVIFASTDRQRHPEIYRFEGDTKDGTYVLTNVPPGEYRVSITQLDEPRFHDQLELAYGLNNSPIVREVKGDGVIDIDLPKELPHTRRRSDD
jgi:hypothetical protein